MRRRRRFAPWTLPKRCEAALKRATAMATAGFADPSSERRDVQMCAPRRLRPRIPSWQRCTSCLDCFERCLTPPGVSISGLFILSYSAPTHQGMDAGRGQENPGGTHIRCSQISHLPGLKSEIQPPPQQQTRKPSLRVPWCTSLSLSVAAFT